METGTCSVHELKICQYMNYQSVDRVISPKNQHLRATQVYFRLGFVAKLCRARWCSVIKPTIQRHILSLRQRPKRSYIYNNLKISQRLHEISFFHKT